MIIGVNTRCWIGYTYDEKMHIARRFLLPKQLQANGLEDAHITITEPALLHIATRYTREAGVRSLERAIGGVVRYKAVEWAEFVDGGGSEGTAEGLGKTLTDGTGDGAMVVVDGKTRRGYRRVVEEHEVEKILGIARWDGEEREREERRGVVYGLVVMGQGEGGDLTCGDDRYSWKRDVEVDGKSWRRAFLSHGRYLSRFSHYFRAGDQGEWRIGFELGENPCV